MQHLLKCIFFLFLIVSASIQAPTPTPPNPALGTIHGSPVVAIIHGDSDVLKDEVQGKDTEDDPLEKFGKLLE